ncbi:MAG: hypothetical protein HZB68_04105 [Candidatus Aenigmarchaeota archaeon]|nr:hypothetical protein [Candidatus Aenigmarchaeota archaeon]
MKEMKVKPSGSMYAEEVMVINTIKSEKNGEDVNKQGFMRLTFVDTLSGKAVADVTVSSITARALHKILSENIAKMEKDLKSKDAPEQIVESKESTTYIG